MFVRQKQIDMKCSKCDGCGILKHYTHIASGRCFMCGGSGTIPETKKNTKSYSEAFLKQYAQPGFFPEDQSSMVKVKCIGFEGHPTAERWIMMDEDSIYIGQPVCMSSDWYKISLSEFHSFVPHFEKVKKISVLL